MPLKLSKLWPFATKKKKGSAVTAFDSDREVAKSEPSSPKHHSEDCQVDFQTRPSTVPEEIRQFVSEPASAGLRPPALELPPPVSPACAPPNTEVVNTPTESPTPGGRQDLSPLKVVRRDFVAESASCGCAQQVEPEPRQSDASTEAPLEATATATTHPDWVKMDAALSEVGSRVEESFGVFTATSLRSTKWDKRVQALKAIGAVLKSLELGGAMGKPSAMKGLKFRDHASCWRTACQVLNRSLVDKVLPVRLASYDLFCDTFANTDGAISKDERHYAMRQLLGPIIERLGDSNLRLHEGARGCVLFCARAPQLVGLRSVLSTLLSHLVEKGCGRDRVRVHFGIVDTVNFLLRHFPVSAVDTCWTQDDIVPFVLAGMDDALGPRTRTSTITLAVTLRVAFGSEAMQPIVMGLRPAIRAVLQDKFAECDDEIHSQADDSDAAGGFVEPSADLMAGLVVCGSAIQAPRFPSKEDQRCALPGANDEEEELLDNILEETGMVFGQGRSVNESTIPFRTKQHLSQMHGTRDYGSRQLGGNDAIEDFEAWCEEYEHSQGTEHELSNAIEVC